TRVAENAHPRAVLAPVFRVPGVAYGTEHTFRVRHHNGRTTAFAGHRSDTVHRTVRVSRIGFRDLAEVINKAQRHQTFAFKLRQMRCITYFNLPFTVGNGDWHLRTHHALQQQRRALRHFHQAETCFKAVRLVTHKARPGFTARDQLTQVRHHLAAVTHAQRQGLWAMEEGFELVAHAAV